MSGFSLTYFDDAAHLVAERLIGAEFLVDGVGGRLVEVEAYGPDDPASHSFRGPTPRNRAMFSVPGTIYVYRSYGIHWCANIVCRPGSAVLLRALVPTAGIEAMKARRGGMAERLLCAGPGRLTQALAIDLSHDGRSIAEPPFVFRPAAANVTVARGPRIGITKGVETPWRFALAESPYLSRPLRPG
ncbi:DNA-3-methyladenine glycosylase [Pelagibacterium lacus]|uniref:Putative 3-methyladenine DNA glycosylase n=1 Tax=Pelagibacterium lacus TaxID=2282655 RepID=A0A369W6X0_9HYPH|nr:DNA-3-methyladenine glycosylase [Pelagibacterium lacus]RDE09787.1 DNA-3-methyladenine glycosylase [Pelagibacterium lacus]